MRIAYYDESGDDGYPNLSSNFFVLTAVYLHYLHWEETFEELLNFRRQLKTNYNIPISMEFHTGDFLKRKKPFTGFNMSTQDRIHIMDSFCNCFAELRVKIINVCIVKNRITSPNYKVLDTALRYSIQRIENDLNPTDNPETKFVLITDDGRHGMMRKTTRKMRRINYVPSQFDHSSIRRDIKSLLEDPLPKDSKESYFIQMADLVSYIVYLYTCHQVGQPNNIARRVRSYIGATEITNWMDILRPCLNTQASSHDNYGVVFHPR